MNLRYLGAPRLSFVSRGRYASLRSFSPISLTTVRQPPTRTYMRNAPQRNRPERVKQHLTRICVCVSCVCLCVCVCVCVCVSPSHEGETFPSLCSVFRRRLHFAILGNTLFFAAYFCCPSKPTEVTQEGWGRTLGGGCFLLSVSPSLIPPASSDMHIYTMEQNRSGPVIYKAPQQHCPTDEQPVGSCMR